MIGQEGLIQAGVLKTMISKPGQPLEPEQWAEVITDSIITVAATAQEPLRSAALDMRAGIKKILTHYVTQVREEQLAYLIKER